MKRAGEGPTIFSMRAICSGSVESSTWISGRSTGGSNVIWKTSGARLEPPIPSRMISRIPSSVVSARQRSRSFTCPSAVSTAPSHPNHLDSSLPVQSDESRAQSRLIFPLVFHSLSVSPTSVISKIGSRSESGLIFVGAFLRFFLSRLSMRLSNGSEKRRIASSVRRSVTSSSEIPSSESRSRVCLA